MQSDSRWGRVLIVAGFVVMLAGTVDPLEGSVLILAGIAAMAAGAAIAHRPERRGMYLAVALGIVGVAILFGVSAIGGFGGRTGRSMWWAVVLLPYVIAWVLGLVFGIKLLRRPAAA